MRFHRRAGRCVVIVLLTVVAGIFLAGRSAGTRAAEEEADAKEKPFPRPVVSTKRLMDMFGAADFQRLRRAMQREPASEAHWKVILQGAEQMAEFGNLTVLRNDYGAEGENGNGAPDAEARRKWGALSRSQLESAEGIIKATEGEDFQTARRHFEQLVKDCNDCHEAFAPLTAPELKP